MRQIISGAFFMGAIHGASKTENYLVLARDRVAAAGFFSAAFAA